MIRKQRAWVAPRPGETRRSGFKSLRPHSSSARPAFPLAGLVVGPTVSMLLADRRLAWIARLGDRTTKGNAGAQV